MHFTPQERFKTSRDTNSLLCAKSIRFTFILSKHLMVVPVFLPSRKNANLFTSSGISRRFNSNLLYNSECLVKVIRAFEFFISTTLLFLKSHKYSFPTNLLFFVKGIHIMLYDNQLSIGSVTTLISNPILV